MSEHEVLTDEEFAAEMKVFAADGTPNVRLVHELCRRGVVRAFKVGRDWRITRGAAEEFKANRGSAA